MGSLISRLHEMISYLCWPRFCTGCGSQLPPSDSSCFCKHCQNTLIPIHPLTSCPVCSCPFLDAASFSNHGQKPQKLRCKDCLFLAPVFHRITAAYEYGGLLVGTIHKMKWGGQDHLAKPLASLLLPQFLDCMTRCDLVLSIPLDRIRLAKRGFNQTVLLSEHLNRFVKNRYPIYHHLLLRLKPSLFMPHKDRAARLKQTQNAFVISKRGPSLLRGRSILLVDDVVTTGSTLQACSLALLEAGANRVEGLALCRASESHSLM